MLKGSQHLEKWKQVHVKGILMFFAFWFCYGLISLLWVKSATDGIKYLFLLAMGMFFVFLVVMFFKNGSYSRVLLHMACHDRIFNGHRVLQSLYVKPPAELDLYNGPHYKQHYPTSVFSTRMTLRHFCPSAFLLFIFFKNIKNSYLKIAGLILAFCSAYLIFLTGSRASILGS